MREAERLKRIDMRTLVEASSRSRRAKQLARNPVPRGGYSQLLEQSGIYLPVPVWITVVCVCGALISYAAWHLIGGLAGLCGGVLFIYHFTISYLHSRSEERRRNVVPHLPGLVDALEASLGAGYPMETALEHAADAIPAGVLKEELGKVIMLLRTRVTLDDALSLLIRSIAGQEILALVITLRLFSGSGARAAAPLHRLGARMRERHAVLVRTSCDSERITHTFYLVLALAVAFPLLFCAVKPAYVIAAVVHPVHRLILEAALVTQLVCLMYFKNLTTMRA